MLINVSSRCWWLRKYSHILYHCIAHIMNIVYVLAFLYLNYVISGDSKSPCFLIKILTFSNKTPELRKNICWIFMISFEYLVCKNCRLVVFVLWAKEGKCGFRGINIWVTNTYLFCFSCCFLQELLITIFEYYINQRTSYIFNKYSWITYIGNIFKIVDNNFIALIIGSIFKYSYVSI